MVHDRVIRGVTGPGRENGEKGSMLALNGLKWGVKRSKRGFLLAITGIIASNNQFHTDSALRQRIVGEDALAATIDCNPLKSLRLSGQSLSRPTKTKSGRHAPTQEILPEMSVFCSR